MLCVCCVSLEFLTEFVVSVTVFSVLDSGKRMDAVTPEEARRRMLAAGHEVIAAEGQLLTLADDCQCCCVCFVV